MEPNSSPLEVSNNILNAVTKIVLLDILPKIFQPFLFQQEEKGQNCLLEPALFSLFGQNTNGKLFPTAEISLARLFLSLSRVPKDSPNEWIERKNESEKTSFSEKRS